MFLHQIARSFPTLLIPYVNILHPYLKSAYSDSLSSTDDNNTKLMKAFEERVAASIVSIFGCVVPYIQDPDVKLWSNIESNLISSLNKRSAQVFSFDCSKYFHELRKIGISTENVLW